MIDAQVAARGQCILGQQLHIRQEESGGGDNSGHSFDDLRNMHVVVPAVERILRRRIGGVYVCDENRCAHEVPLRLEVLLVQRVWKATIFTRKATDRGCVW